MTGLIVVACILAAGSILVLSALVALIVLGIMWGKL